MVFIAKWLTSNEEVISGDEEMHVGERREWEGSVEGRECLHFTHSSQRSARLHHRCVKVNSFPFCVTWLFKSRDCFDI